LHAERISGRGCGTTELAAQKPNEQESNYGLLLVP
jgi:hypothetical protein